MERIELFVVTQSAKFFEQVEITSKDERFMLHPPTSRFTLSRRQRVDFRREPQSTFVLHHLQSLDGIPEDALVIAEASLLVGADGRLVRIKRSWVLVAVEVDEEAKVHFVRKYGFKRDDVLIEADLKLHALLNIMVLKQTVGRLSVGG